MYYSNVFFINLYEYLTINAAEINLNIRRVTIRVHIIKENIVFSIKTLLHFSDCIIFSKDIKKTNMMS